ncbi:nucleotide pyrophosphohydrolase [bacterium]|nr:MAG: nucleotide pyrophosphohydrolase [bacterium]
MKNDTNTTLRELSELTQKFINERDWAKYHSPKDISASLSVEAGELLELFLWRSTEKIYTELEQNEKFKTQVKEELADILFCCLNFANLTNIDISQAFRDKLAKSALKYPTSQVNTVEKYFALKYKDK